MERTARYYNKCHRPVTFKVGDRVQYKLRIQSNKAKNIQAVMEPKYSEPCENLLQLQDQIAINSNWLEKTKFHLTKLIIAMHSVYTIQTQKAVSAAVRRVERRKLT